MKVLTLCKRRSSSRDLITERFGRYYQLPVALAASGVQSLVLAADYSSGSIDEITVGSAKFVSLPLFVHGIHSYLRRVGDAARRFGPDMVLAGSDTQFGWVGRRIARQLNVPFVFDVFDNYESFASGRIPGVKRLFHSLAHGADLTVVVSDSLGHLLELGDHVAVVPNGVDMDLFRPRFPGGRREPSPTATVGYVGGLARDRGVETLVEAVSILRRRGADLRMEIAGPLERGFNPPSETWIHNRGFVDHSEVPQIIAGLDVAVLPYPDTAWARHTSSYKVLEYMACEVPVVVTDISNYRQLAASVEAVAQPGDPEDMARAIEFQLRNRRIVPRKDAWSWHARAGDLLGAMQALLNA